MSPEHKLYTYLSDGISFVSEEAARLRTIYFPLCGPTDGSLKSSITPYLSGDIKIDRSRFLTKPVSTEDLRSPVRNFFCYIHDKGVMSLAGEENNDASVEAGPLWHRVTKKNNHFGLEISATSFIPASGEHVELMRIKVTNTSKKPMSIAPSAAIPIFGRALENKHDHEHVTSLLQRIEQRNEGVMVVPSMRFNEEGHTTNDTAYFVFGNTAEGKKPFGSFPTVESFCGDCGTMGAPAAVLESANPSKLGNEALQGKEAVGALKFKDLKLKKGESQEFIIVMGIADNAEKAVEIYEKYNTVRKFDKALKVCKEFWSQKAHSITFRTGEKDFNSWLHWVTIQPVLRRIFGCSFLPEHDYGKGGKGWRDIWQDLLSLILIEPENIRGALVNNFAGVRIDGSNATIIGSRPGEFLADRNAIARVWMDHGAWPLMTLGLYIHQTGDLDILLESVSYFRDHQLSRSAKRDGNWQDSYGRKLKSMDGNPYTGSILEHTLIQHLVQFFNVGENNNIRLENADWNDGFDMAAERGESVSFTSFYGGNLFFLAELLEALEKEKGITEVALAKEVLVLLDSLSPNPCDYDKPKEKQTFLVEKYFAAVEPEISGEKINMSVKEICMDLRQKGGWIFSHIRKNEKISVDGNEWFNGYYDNKAKRVEGEHDKAIRMTLTGQVYPVMSGMADENEIEAVVKSVKKYLRDRKLGGYRLNTDFGVMPYLDLGRAFGFAFGTKENGAFFSHMNVMYAYALYKRGFAREGYKVLRTIYKMAVDTSASKIYPGVPEYFDAQGRGMYHYLTGAASWFVLTELTQAFGVCGRFGNLVLAPQLMREEFNIKGEASVKCQFAGKELKVIYENDQVLDYGDYKIKEVGINDIAVDARGIGTTEVIVERESVLKLPDENIIRVKLSN